MITVEHLVKEFKIPIRKKGHLAVFKNLLPGEYKIKRAVDDVSFTMEKGDIVGYIGKNGAGKSTTIKMLSGILQPTHGKIIVNGIEPSKNRVENARQIGVVFGQKSQLWWDIPLIESYRLLKEIYQIDESRFKKNLDTYVTLLGLEDILEKPVRQMSLGQRVKSDIAAALLHDPSVLFLDEPTIGVDIISKKYLHDFILQINKEKQTTIILTTHDMADIEKLCSHLIIIDDGKLMYKGTIEEMMQKFGTTRYLLVKFASNVDDFPVPGADLIKSEMNTKLYSFNRHHTSPSELISYIDQKYPVVDLQIIETDMESIVRKLYEQK